MNDPYRIDPQTPSNAPARAPGRTPDGGPLSTLLWALVAISIGLNAAFTMAGLDLIGSTIGGVAVICLAVLLVRYLQRRRAQ